jgi:hypothetical protein
LDAIAVVDTKLFGMAGVLLAVLALTGVLGIMNLDSAATQGNDMYVNNTVTIAQLGEARADLAKIDSSVLQALRGTSGAIQGAQQASQTLQGVMKQYAAAGLSGAEQTFYNRYRPTSRPIRPRAPRSPRTFNPATHRPRTASTTRRPERSTTRSIRTSSSWSGSTTTKLPTRCRPAAPPAGRSRLPYSRSRLRWATASPSW